MMQVCDNQNISRRRFFQSLMIASSGVLVGSSVASDTNQALQPNESESPKVNQGYQETSHIRQYYQSISRC